MIKVNRLKRTIFLLTGFMCAGKTSFGEKAANKLNCEFIDLDDYIEKKESKSIKDLFQQNGEEYFRIKETEYFSQILNIQTNLRIIALGGGFPLIEKNQLLMKKATTIFINSDLDLILSRLNELEISKRPLLTNIDTEKIKLIYKERLPVYKMTADYITNNLEELIDFISLK